MVIKAGIIEVNQKVESRVTVICYDCCHRDDLTLWDDVDFVNTKSFVQKMLV